ncbi:MAG: 16S rRNA (cytosine(1402)-N(4))-methyltransferase, partial [Patescibacteria group bacterium]
MTHQPVLLNEVLEWLKPKRGDFVIDGTIDGGGHAGALLEKISPGGKLLGVDWDDELLAKCEARLGERPNVTLVHGNYADLPEILRKKKLSKADGLLLDLGFSSEQLAAGRGFSFTPFGEEPLLMTYAEDRRPVREILARLS